MQVAPSPRLKRGYLRLYARGCVKQERRLFTLYEDGVLTAALNPHLLPCFRVELGARPAGAVRIRVNNVLRRIDVVEIGPGEVVLVSVVTECDADYREWRSLLSAVVKRRALGAGNSHWGGSTASTASTAGRVVSLAVGEVPEYKLGVLVPGKGLCGEWREAVKVGGGEPAEAKVYAMHGMSGTDRALAGQEIELVNAGVLRDPVGLVPVKHIVSVLGEGSNESGVALIMPPFPRGTLENLLLDRGCLASRQAAIFAVELLLGIAHLHAHGAVHRNIAPQHIYVEVRDSPAVGGVEPLGVRLGDFEYACRVSQLAGGVRVTGTYMAPEMLGPGKQKQNERIDMFAVGAVLFEMLTGESPFAGACSLPALIAHIRAADYSFTAKQLARIDPAAVDLVSKLLVADPAVRLTAREALLHPYVAHFVPAFQGPRNAVRSAQVRRGGEQTASVFVDDENDSSTGSFPGDDFHLSAASSSSSSGNLKKTVGAWSQLRWFRQSRQSAACSGKLRLSENSAFPHSLHSSITAGNGGQTMRDRGAAFRGLSRNHMDTSKLKRQKIDHVGWLRRAAGAMGSVLSLSRPVGGDP